eukprot:540618-Amphidinium_carterae.1
MLAWFQRHCVKASLPKVIDDAHAIYDDVRLIRPRPQWLYVTFQELRLRATAQPTTKRGGSLSKFAPVQSAAMMAGIRTIAQVLRL